MRFDGEARLGDGHKSIGPKKEDAEREQGTDETLTEAAEVGCQPPSDDQESAPAQGCRIGQEGK